MRKTLNFRFLIVLVGTFVLFAAGTHVLHGYQVRRNAHGFLKLAERMQQEGRLSNAAGYFQRYLALVPNDTATLAKYGQLLADKSLATTRNALVRAFVVLEQVLRRDPSRNDIRQQTAEIAMQLERFAEARDQLSELLARDEKNAKLRGLLGQCYESLGQFAEARDAYETAINHSPNELDPYFRLAFLLRERSQEVRRNRGDKEKAETFAQVRDLADRTIHQMVEANAAQFSAFLRRAYYHRTYLADSLESTNPQKLIEEDLAKAHALAPDDAEVLLARAEHAQGQGRLAESRELLLHGRTTHAEKWQMYLSLARLEIQENQWPAAMNHLQEGLRKVPAQDQLVLLWSLAEVQIRQGLADQAAKTIVRLEQSGLPAFYPDFLRVQLSFQQEKWLSASRNLERLIPTLLEKKDTALAADLAHKACLLLGECYERLGDTYRASKTYRQALDMDARSVPGRMNLARMEWAMGRTDGALEHFTALMRLPNAPPSGWTEIARLVLLRNLYSPDPDWSEVERAIVKAENVQLRSVDLLILRGEALIAQRKYDEATRILELAYDDDKTRPAGIWVALARVAEQRGQVPAAQAILEQAEQRMPDDPDLRAAVVRFWARNKPANAREKLQQFQHPPISWTPARQREFREILAEAFQTLGEIGQCRQIWTQISEAHPNDLGCRLALFDLFLQTGDESAMDGVVAQMRDIEGEGGSLWRYCRLGQLLRRARPADKELIAEARMHLTRISANRPGWSRIAVCDGHLCELEQAHGMAVKHYQTAIFLGERSPRVIRRAVELLMQQRRFAEAEQVLLKLRETNRNLPGLSRFAAEIALFKQDTFQALQLAKDAVKGDSQDYRDQIWLGQMLWATGQSPKEAELAFQRALKVAKNDEIGLAWTALVQFLHGTGDKERALAEIELAEKKLPLAQALVTIPHCYEVVGLRDRAEKLYMEALTAKADDSVVLGSVARFHLSGPSPQNAMPYLEKLEARRAESRLEAEWATRVRAVLRAAQGGFQNTQQALVLLGLSDNQTLAGTGNTADFRTRAVILAAGKSLEERRQAIGLFENLQKRQSLQLAEESLLARLYASVGETKRSHELWRRLLAKIDVQRTSKNLELDKAYGQYLSIFCNSLFSAKEFAEAEALLTKLENLEPKSSRTVLLKSRLLAAQKREKEAVPLLLSLLESKNASAAAVARELEDLSQFKEAEELYRRQASQSANPQDQLALAKFLGRRGRTPEALAICENAKKTCPAEAVAETAIAILYTGKTPPGARDDIAAWLDKESRNNPTNPLLEALAAIRFLQERYDDVLAIYRKLLAAEKPDSLILNNAAWLLAIRDKNGPEAMKLIQQAILVDGPVADLLSTRAVIHIAMGQPASAVKDLEDAIVDVPSAENYFHLAQAYLSANNSSAAQRAFEAARRLGLIESTLHPLERPAYRQIRSALDSPQLGTAGR